MCILACSYFHVAFIHLFVLLSATCCWIQMGLPIEFLYADDFVLKADSLGVFIEKSEETELDDLEEKELESSLSRWRQWNVVICQA